MRYISSRSKKIKSTIILALVIFGLGVSITLFQTNYQIRQFVGGIFAANNKMIYVSSLNGSDTNTGLAGTPVKTIGRGIALALPGDTVSVESGVYTEHIVLSGKNGTSVAPIRIVGDSVDPKSYPVIDGGDPGYTSTTNNPSIKLTNSSWLTFERLKFQNATYDTISLSNSHYITFRRNKIDYHSHAVLASSNTSHVLMEYNEVYQSYPQGTKWTALKGSKWEGGAFTSFTGAGMNVIRYNYFHDQFNSIYMHRGTSTNKYLSANTWIYRNRFENIVDDSFEPETFAFNNHFFENTLINAHRLISLAPNGLGVLLGPIYVYDNIQILRVDPTGEASTGRVNSAYKMELDSDHFENGVYAFNNSIDLNYPGTNAYAIDFLSGSPTNFYHYNHAYTTPKTAFSRTPTLINSDFNSDLSQLALGYTEKNGYPLTNPGFASPITEDLRPTATSAMRGKSQAVTVPFGFVNNAVIAAGSDLGAYQYGAADFRSVPQPLYVLPPGGEPSGFPANLDWPADIYGGSNPPSGPSWSPMGKITITPSGIAPTPAASPIVTPVASPIATPIATPVPTPVSSPVPTPTPIPTSTPTPTATPTTNTSYQVTLKPIADAHVRAKDPSSNNGTSTTMTVDYNPDKIIYMKFNTAALIGKTIDSIVLNVRLSGSTSTSVTQNIKQVLDQSWTENTITYTKRPPLGKLIGAFHGGGDKTTVNSSLSLGNITTDTISLGIDTSSKTSMNITSRESSYSPYLTITYH